jgi:hypothetical protein
VSVPEDTSNISGFPLEEPTNIINKAPATSKPFNKARVSDKLQDIVPKQGRGRPAETALEAPNMGDIVWKIAKF